MQIYLFYLDYKVLTSKYPLNSTVHFIFLENQVVSTLNCTKSMIYCSFLCNKVITTPVRLSVNLVQKPVFRTNIRVVYCNDLVSKGIFGHYFKLHYS